MGGVCAWEEVCVSGRIKCSVKFVHYYILL